MAQPIRKKVKAPVSKPKRQWIAYLLILAACFVFYGNTLTLKYACDDTIAITDNQFVKQGTHGIGDILSYDFFTGYYGKNQNMVAGGRYRPLSLVTFAIEYQLFGEDPAISHLFNILFLALTALILYKVIRQMLGFAGKTGSEIWFLSVPFVATILFIGHPVHTEVIANIKSRDEILSLLGSLSALGLTLAYLKRRNPVYIVCSTIVFFLALLAKENAMTFLAVIPLTIFVFTKFPLRKYLETVIPLIIISIVFLLLRYIILGHTQNPLENDLMNNPFVEMTLLQKYATIVYTLGLYLKLLVFPHPLTYDYYPYHIPIMNWSDWQTILSLLLYILITVYAVIRIRKKDLYSFSIFYYFITISVASNLLFPIGAFMNERFLFMPSVGFCFAFAWFVLRDIPLFLKNHRVTKILIPSFLGIILLLCAVKTISRNSDWYDSERLFTTDVKVSRNSAKGNETAGEYLMIRATGIKDKAVRDSILRVSIRYQQKAVSIYPKQIIALINMAAAYNYLNQDYDTILIIYKKILYYLPNEEHIYQIFNALMNNYHDNDHKIRLYQSLLEVNRDRWDLNMNLGELYDVIKGDPISAIPYFRKAAELKPSDFITLDKFGIVLAEAKKWKEADSALHMAEKLNPDDPNLLQNLAVVNQRLGNNAMALYYFQRYSDAAKKK